MLRQFRWTVLLATALLATLSLAGPANAAPTAQTTIVDTSNVAEAGCDLVVDDDELSGKCEVEVDVLDVGNLKVTCTGFIFDLQGNTEIAGGRCKVTLTTPLGTSEADCAGSTIEFVGPNTILIQPGACDATLHIGGATFHVSCLQGPLATINTSTLMVILVDPTTYCTIS